MYLLDVQSNTDEGSLSRLIVFNPDHSEDQTISPKRGRQDWYERLHRYAAQQLYAPERLIESDASIRRVRISNKPLTGLLRDARLQVTPIASWSGGDFFITAIQLQNNTEQSLALVLPKAKQANLNNPNAIHIATVIRGRWLTASVQHAHLAPKNQQVSTTTLYLVSKRPFYESWEGSHGA